MREFASSLLVSKFMDDSLYSAKHVQPDDAKHYLAEHCGFYDIISPKGNQAKPKAPFGFLGLINEQTACEAGSRAPKVRVCELMKECISKIPTKKMKAGQIL